MPNVDPTSPTPRSSESLADRLDSWKAIAAFLGRGVRTVQRWEREEGLPVHRLSHDKRGSVYARRDEITAWWESRRVSLELRPTGKIVAESALGALRLERVTRTSSMTTSPAVSSDGRLVAYISDGGQDGATPQVWVQQLGGAALRLTRGEHHYSSVSFVPGDTHVMFTAADETGSSVYEVATLGGEPRRVQRGARSARISPDGRWLASIPTEAVGIRIVPRGEGACRTLAPDLIDVASLAWLPDGCGLIVHARLSPTLEADWWVVPIDGAPPINTGVIRALPPPTFVVPNGVACVGDSVVFSAASPNGLNLYQQRLRRPTFQPVGPPRQLTAGDESAVLPAVGADKLAFVSRREDSNLWSVAVDASSGAACGPLRRLSRGPGILVSLSVTRDFRTLVYSSVRSGEANIFSRDLRTGVETTLTGGPGGVKWYPAISPSGRQVAFGIRVMGTARAARPIVVALPQDDTWRMVDDDCRGRPREWVDERLLIVERFGRLNGIAVLDTETAAQRELLESAERSITNARLSPDRRWIAFDAARPGTTADVFLAPFRETPIPEADWLLVERSASHPFWSADGRLLYFMPTGTNPTIRSSIRARHIAMDPSESDRESVAVYSSAEMVMPAYLPGTAPIATPDEILLVLGDFRGDVWSMHLESR